ncbi:MAG: hypothetical protein K0R09_2921 [Clostridiales bacterium]|jgi:DNA-binding FrmR family transcriptional regulator|nr:hypothetical protein [Clostridiales bacterium]
MNEEQLKAVKYLKTVRGQVDGILKMLDEGRYCVDISNQIAASQSLLKKANMLILKQHMNHCVKEAFLHDKGEEKVNEIVDMLEKLIDK